MSGANGFLAFEDYEEIGEPNLSQSNRPLPIEADVLTSSQPLELTPGITPFIFREHNQYETTLRCLIGSLRVYHYQED